MVNVQRFATVGEGSSQLFNLMQSQAEEYEALLKPEGEEMRKHILAEFEMNREQKKNSVRFGQK